MQSTKTLIDYYIIDLSKIREDQVEFVLQELNNIGNIPVKLRGNTSLFILAKVFVTLRNKAEEIVYQKSNDQSAVVLYSQLDPKQYVRPYHIRLAYTEGDLAEESLASQAYLQPIELPVFTDHQQRLAFLFKYVFIIDPNNQSIEIVGKPDAITFILALDWLLFGAHHIRINGEEII